LVLASSSIVMLFSGMRNQPVVSAEFSSTLGMSFLCHRVVDSRAFSGANLYDNYRRNGGLRSFRYRLKVHSRR
jgi:hypothetical protein